MTAPVCTSSPSEDIGHGVTIERRYIDGVLNGVEYRHDCSAGLHAGYIPIGAGGPSEWALENEKPITLSPSLLCPRCGHHGFIREGRWVPA